VVALSQHRDPVREFIAAGVFIVAWVFNAGALIAGRDLNAARVFIPGRALAGSIERR